MICKNCFHIQIIFFLIRYFIKVHVIKCSFTGFQPFLFHLCFKNNLENFMTQFNILSPFARIFSLYTIYLVQYYQNTKQNISTILNATISNHRHLFFLFPKRLLFCTKIRVLHEVELVDGVGYGARCGYAFAVVGVRLQLEVLQGERVRSGFVEVVVICTIVEGDVGAAEALARMGRVVIWNKEWRL